jgi:hypothetical protein
MLIKILRYLTFLLKGDLDTKSRNYLFSSRYKIEMKKKKNLKF